LNDSNNIVEESVDENRLSQLIHSIRRRAPLDAVVLLERENNTTIAAVLQKLDYDLAMRLLSHLPTERAENLFNNLDVTIGEQWSLNLNYDEDSVGRLMEPLPPTFATSSTVAEVVEKLRVIAQKRNIIYAFAVSEDMKLEGVIVMRDLLLADPSESLADVMVSEPFYFTADTSIEDAMSAVLMRHYPMYPVCDKSKTLLGFVHGYALFEKRTFQLTALPGSMMGVEKVEQVNTPWMTCLRYRHPWLQLNLLTALMAGAVVGIFEDTIARVVVLAAFLPVLAGQSGNTGCQALAVTLRSMTLNELKPGMGRHLITKEAALGLSNGLLVGLTAGATMFFYAHIMGAEAPMTLAAVVTISMIGACIASGVIGVMVPLTLSRFGADPVTASTIFLTTATDVLSIGLLLALATVMI
jgi:magnesium transporter